MASIKGHKSSEMGLHEEVLTGRTQQVFFNPEESENLGNVIVFESEDIVKMVRR